MSNRTSGARTRKTILSVAKKLFRQNGYRRTTMKAIAETAGLTFRTIKANFPTKQALFCDLYMTEKLSARRTLLKLFKNTEYTDRLSVKTTLEWLCYYVHKSEFLLMLYMFGDFPVRHCIEGTSWESIPPGKNSADPLTGHSSLLEEFIESCQKAGTIRKGNPAEITMVMRTILHLILIDRDQWSVPVSSIITIVVDGLVSD